MINNRFIEVLISFDVIDTYNEFGSFGAIAAGAYGVANLIISTYFIRSKIVSQAIYSYITNGGEELVKTLVRGNEQMNVNEGEMSFEQMVEMPTLEQNYTKIEE